VRAAVRAEVLKLRTTRTTYGLAGAMAGLVVLSVALHSLGLTKPALSLTSNQLRVFTEGGETIGAVFAALLGALSITGEIRHGTIRPTFLGIPQRRTVMLAKAFTSVAAGVLLGLAATALAAGLGTALLTARGVTVHLGTGDYGQLVLGGALAAGLWSIIGLGVGAIARNQVATIVGLFVWLQIVENLLTDSVPTFSRYMPGSLAAAVAGGQTATLSSAALALALLVAYAAVAIALGTRQTLSTDFA
jgi:ABC-2 type transport system permease protein